MEWPVLVSSLSLALLFLVPLGIKWQIKTGYTLIGAIAIGSATGIIFSWDLLRQDISIQMLIPLEFVFILILALATIVFFFYRDPERHSPQEPGVIVSPADGEVIYVKAVSKSEIPHSKKNGRKFVLNELIQTDLLSDENYLVGIGMNLLNVHVNRAPIQGRVELLKHIKGTFLSLKIKEAIVTNERFTTVISNGKFKVGVVQIASRLVRKIVSYLAEDELVQVGQRIGMIKFGSQVDLIIPKFEGLTLKIKPGDQVMAGISVIAEFEQAEISEQVGKDDSLKYNSS